MSREFYMGVVLIRGYGEIEGVDSWNPMYFLNSCGGTSKISNRLNKTEPSFEKLCEGCVNFAANADEAGEAFKKMVESLNKIGGNSRYV